MLTKIISPGFVFTSLLFIFASVAIVLPENYYIAYWNTPKYFEIDDYLYCLLVNAFFLFGCFIAKNSLKRNIAIGSPVDYSAEYVRVFYTTFIFALVSNIIWLQVAIENGLSWQVLVDSIGSNDPTAYMLPKFLFETIPGITTLSQMSLFAISTGFTLSIKHKKNTIIYLTIFILLLTTVRTIIMTDRGGLIEILVFILLGPAFNFFNNRKKIYTDILIIALAMFFVFAYGEFVKVTMESYDESNFFIHSFFRLAGYYVTSLNNGALLSNTLSEGWGIPVGTLEFIWRLPFIKEYITPEMYIGFDPQDYFMNLITVYANGGLNTIAYCYHLLLDYGYFGSLLYISIFGYFMQFIYLHFLKREVWAILLYSLCFFALFDHLRIAYLQQGKNLPLILYCLLLFVIFKFKHSSHPLVTKKVKSI